MANNSQQLYLVGGGAAGVDISCQACVQFTQQFLLHGNLLPVLVFWIHLIIAVREIAFLIASLKKTP